MKRNAPELLEDALRRKRPLCMIGTGAMCDPYLPLEKELLLTRRCLEIIDRYDFGVSILTKSDLILRAHGIHTGVWLCPISPFINDTEENLRGLLNYCFDAGVEVIVNFGMGVTLRDGDREYFYTQLDRQFPGMKERYIRTFGDRYQCFSPNHTRD